MTQATTNDYWISSTALHIELNALGYPDYVQASCVSGAQILVYVKDIIGFDAGHNYRRWPLQASPTVFNSHTEKYVYAAIPRSLSSAASARIVFPSEQIDIYGKNANAEQIGDEKYYYIFLQGKITSSGDNGTIARDWDTRCFWGYLSSDEAISAIGTESEWYHYSQTDSIVTFLKKLTMKPGTWFRELFAKAVTIVTGGSIAFEGKAGAISGITNTKTPLDSETDIVTPKYLDDNALSSVHDDEAKGVISFLSGIKFISNNKIHKITSDGIATLKEVVSAAFRSGALGSGFKLGDYNADGDSYLEVDRLLVRKAAEFVRLVIRELQSVGGEIVLSPAAMKVSNVVYFAKGTVLPEYNGYALRYDVYRCYFSQKKGDEEIENQFAVGDLVRCQTFNVKKGVNENVKNRYYWRKVYKVGADFIDVLADFCDTGSDIPQAGDELVQMGNVSDTARQSVVVLSAYGADAPSFKMYYGVDSYSLENRDVFVLSRQEMFAIADKFRFVTRNANGEIESTQSFAELVMSVDGLRLTVNANKSDVDGKITTMNSVIKQMPDQILIKVGEKYPTKTDVNTQIESASSAIIQTATNIALKVGYTLAERRNLLVGSLFRKQDEGCFLLRSKIYRTSAHEGANVIFAPDAKAGGAQWGGAANSRNIHVAKGKTYTLAFWARTKSAKVEIVGETIWHSSATDTSRPSGYTGPNGSANLGGVTITPSNGWYLYQKTFTVAANAPYEWISVACLKANASTASQQVYIAHPILIEGTAEDFVCWSASPDDYDYISGNLLDNTRTFTKAGNLMRLDASIVTNESYNNGCSVIYANGASKYVEMAQWSVNTIIKKGEDYILSFMAKGSGNIDAYMWSGSNLSIFAEDSEHDTTTQNADGGRRLPLTDEWKRYWVHWRSEGTGIPNYVLIRCLQGSKAWVTMPKLEVGATPTDWIEGKSGFIEDSGIAAKLLRTGLDIENGKITATADKFEVRNNSGKVTASVNKDGLLEVGSGVFGGSLVGVSGTFSKLTHVSNANVSISFDQQHGGLLLKGYTINDGSMRVYGDFSVDGETNVGVLRTEDTWVRGSFGALNRVCASISDGLMRVYSGEELFAETRLKTSSNNGITYYNVPCQVDVLHEGFTLVNGFGNGAPIDTFVFKGNSQANLVYNFKLSYTQKITVLHAVDSVKNKIFVPICGKNTELVGGLALQLWKAPRGFSSPSMPSVPGQDVFVISRYDNNWA
ncbi:carbohydrate binding domain-containing protein [uncultured Prevotella sp.]|uniref:carbohydrate binding domain-containing protein n=1 Tax=uncultured Prevotella sp. TaxID=159272 RepID=UPI0027E3A220|nr:carbohydrate binding domain-containing protein [uncultured Prevotella sp.]